MYRNVSVCEQLADCSLLARLLYSWGLPHTSNYGVLAASPRRIKAQILPISTETAEEVGGAVDELVAQGLWVRFEDGGSSYIHYPTFDKSQDIHKRAGRPRDGLPLPGTSGHFRELAGSSGDCLEVPATVRVMEGKRIEGKLREEKRKHPLSQEPDDAPETPPQPTAVEVRQRERATPLETKAALLDLIPVEAAEESADFIADAATWNTNETIAPPNMRRCSVR